MSFATIVADPPWRVSAGRTIGAYKMVDGKQVFGVRDNAARKLSYPSMSVDEIKALPVADFSAENAHLYLWTVNRYISEAYEVAKAWGFTPSTMLTWAKNPMGGGLGGDAFGISSEYCLFCRRGKAPAQERIGTTWFNWKRPYKNGAPRHSAKPPEFFEIVERVSLGPRVELFARDHRPGWSVWGNEVESDIELAFVS